MAVPSVRYAVPARNEAAHPSEALAYIDDQTAPEPYEVIVADVVGSTEDAPEP